MKFVICTTVSLWLICGLIGAWMLNDLGADNWKKVARGPITLAVALQEHPITISGLD